MSPALESRLRMLLATYAPEGTRDTDDLTFQARALLSIFREAAAIGAELEREGCVDVIATSGDVFRSVVDQAAAQARLRARGGR